MTSKMDSRFDSFVSSNSTVAEEKKQEYFFRQDTTAEIEDDILATVQGEVWYSQSLLVVVVGASGDLAKKKTYPALYALWSAGLLPRDTVIWGFARSAKANDEFRLHLKPFLKAKDEDSAADFLELCYYRQGASYADWQGIQSILNDTQRVNTLIYLAIPPNVFGDSTGAIMKARRQGVLASGGFFRVVLEKPFGKDTDSCNELLQALVDQKWPEQELYRIDHYLGKEMVQNILSMRQHNYWMRALWNKDVIQSVHLIWKEDIGTEGRGGYFDPYGIVRDILQNHLLQVLTLVAMDTPDSSWTSDDIRDAKVNVLKAMPTVQLSDCLLGQYDGYRDDPTIVNRETVSPTYACIRTTIDTPRWEGVPFVLEAGKALNERVCEVRLHFRQGSGGGSKHSEHQGQPNALVMRLQPTPRVFFTANLKTPGFSSQPASTHLGVGYEQHVSDIPDAYTRLLLDVLRSQQENFVRSDELVEAWRVFTPVLHQTERQQVEPLPYRRGTAGPSVRPEFLRSMGVTQPWLPLASAL